MTASDGKSDNVAKKDDSVALLEQRIESAAIDNTRVSFLTSEDEEARIRLALERGYFIGFSKEELMKFERDPGWKRLRLILLILFWLAWALLLIAAIVVIIQTPACPGRPVLQWPEKYPIYSIHVPSFRVGSKCPSGAPALQGNVDGVIDVLTAQKDNYFDRLSTVDIFWLRGINKLGTSESQSLEPASENLDKLYEVAKKKQRRILLDLLPFKTDSEKNLNSLECGLFSGALYDPSIKVPYKCVDSESDVEKMIEFVHKNRNNVNGFVLDYSKYIINTKGNPPIGKSPLEKIFEAVTRGPSGESASGDNAKHLFVRFPLLDKRFINAANKENLIKERIQEEEIVRNAGVRVIIDTIFMGKGEASCGDPECLAQLINTVQTFSNRTSAYRAFAIDDPQFSYRTGITSVEDGTKWNTPQALAAVTLTGFPGTPVIYYGSEIAMASSTASTAKMQWTEKNNNTCFDSSSYMCFCNRQCSSPTGVVPRTCPDDKADQHHDATVHEQIRDESSGLFKSFTQLLVARMNNDSLAWGNAEAYVNQTNQASQKILMVLRQANQFEKFGLFISLPSASKDPEAVPHLPDNLVDQCYQTVYSFANGMVSSSEKKQKFSHMVLKKDEIRLVRVFRSCGTETK